MNARARIGQAVFVGGSAVLLSALSLTCFIVGIGGPSKERPPTYWFETAVLCLVLSTPWMAAAWLLLRARTAIDPPARLLAVATATLPEGRRDWGAAMAAELEQVHGCSARWRFALGCARAAIFPPRLARSHRLRRPSSEPVVMAVGLTAVASCIAATAYLIDQYPTAARHLHPAAAVLLATILAGALWLVVAPPRPLIGDRLALHLAVGAALLLDLGLLLLSRAELRNGAQGIYGYLFSWPILAIFATAMLVSAVRRSTWAGVQATVWATLLASLGFFAIAVAESVRWYQAAASLILAGDAVPLDAVGENLRNFTWFLIVFPLSWTPFGLIGAAIGRAVRRAR